VTELPTEEQFRAAIGETIEMRLSPGASVPLVVAEVTSLGEREVAPGTGIRSRPFSVLFRGPADLEPAQRMYPLVHDGMGEFELFLVPLGTDDQGMRLEAVFG
jgi:hypothetical protein